MPKFGKKRKDDGAEEKLSSEERRAQREARREARKNKAKPGSDDGEDSGRSGKSVGANRKKDETIIREMVFETAMSLMKPNKLFRVTRDDEDLYVGILLKFESIGGLSKKDMRDESKGQIITLINNGGIASVFTNELKAKECIVFIPDKSTLAQMAEFSLLADDLDYELVLVNPYDETIENTGVFVNLDYLQKCHNTNTPISGKLAKVLEPTLMPGDDGYNRQPEPAPAPEPAAPAQPAYVPPDDLPQEPEPDGEPYEDDYGGDSPPDSGDDGDPFGFDNVGDDDSGVIGEDGDPDAGDGETEGVGTPTAYVSPETSALALSRKFFNDNMARELDTSALDQAIAGISQFRPLLTRPEDTWLNQQLNALIDMANRELFALHQQNLDAVRNGYLNTIGNVYIAEMSQVMDYKSDPRYADIVEQSETAGAGIDEIIAEERARLNEEWDRKVHDAGEAARINAEQSYKQRYQYQHEERLRNIDAEVRAGLQAAENAAVSDLKAVRKQEAEVRLDKRDSEEITKAVEEYKALLEGEAALYEKHESEILKFLEEHREEEIARVKVLGTELERDEKIAQIQAEYKSRAEALKSDFEARTTAMQSDMDRMRARHERDLADKDTAYAELQSKYDADKQEWRGQISDLTDQIVRANESKEREVQIRVAEAKAERDSYSEKYDHLVKTQKSSSLLFIALAVIAAIAALMVGIVIGGRVLGSPEKPVLDAPPAVSDTVLPEGGTDTGTGPESPQDGQEGPSGQDSGGGQGDADGQGGTDRTPEPDPAWDAMQDPVI